MGPQPVGGGDGRDVLGMCAARFGRILLSSSSALGCPRMSHPDTSLLTLGILPACPLGAAFQPIDKGFGYSDSY